MTTVTSDSPSMRQIRMRSGFASMSWTVRVLTEITPLKLLGIYNPITLNVKQMCMHHYSKVKSSGDVAKITTN